MDLQKLAENFDLADGIHVLGFDALRCIVCLKQNMDDQGYLVTWWSLAHESVDMAFHSGQGSCPCIQMPDHFIR